MKKIPRVPNADPERLSIHELLAEHERVFGPLTPQAKQRLERAAGGPRAERWEGMDGLAA
jgi:hypothetical protein